MMPHVPYQTAFINKVQAIIDLDERNTGPIAKVQLIVAELRSKGILRTEENVNPNDVMCHNSNRGGMGLSGPDGHQTMVDIKSSGVDMTEVLKNSSAFEKCPIEPLKSLQEKFNATVVANSKGLFPELLGGERLLSVGAGHWTAMLRAYKHRCRTTQKELADNEGLLDISIWSNNADFMTCYNEGWTWEIFPWASEIAWPMLPDLVQRAKNAGASVPKPPTEFEIVVACNRKAAEKRLTDGKEPDWKMIADEASRTNVAVKDYAIDLAEHGRLFGGGDDAPMIKMLDRFIKSRAPNRAFGAEFWRAVTYANFGMMTKRPTIRLCLLAANGVAPETSVKDGFPRVVVKTDVTRLCGKACVPELDHIEKLHQKAMAMMPPNSSVHDELSDELLCMGVRMVLKLLGKSKLILGGLEFETHEEIGRLFVETCNSNHGTKMKLPKAWATSDTVPCDSQGTDASGHDASNVLSAVTHENLSSPLWCISQKGFEINVKLYHSESKTYWSIDKLTEKKAELLEQVAFGAALKRSVTLAVLIKEFKVFNGNLDVSLAESWHETMAADAIDAYHIGCKKAEVVMAMRTLERRCCSMYSSLLLIDGHKQIRARIAVPTGALMLAPTVPLSSIVASQIPTTSQNAVNLGPLVRPPTSKHTWYFSLVGHNGVPNPDKKTGEQSSWLMPYFWMGLAHSITEDADDANMTKSYQSIEIGGEDNTCIDIPVISNKRALMPNEGLVILASSMTPGNTHGKGKGKSVKDGGVPARCAKKARH